MRTVCKGIELFMLFAISVSTLSAQSNQACVKKVRDYLKKADDLTSMKKGAVHYTWYSQEIVMWDSLNTPAQKVDVKIYMNSDHMQYITPDLEVYQDSKDAFMIIHSRKKVIWGNADAVSVANSKERIAKISSYKDTLFALSTVLKCDKVKQSDESSVGRLILKLTKEGRKLFQIDRIEYLYELETGKVLKITTHFVPENEVKRMVVVNKAVDPNYKGINLSKPFSSMIIKGKNKLSSQYKGYELLDNR